MAAPHLSPHCFFLRNSRRKKAPELVKTSGVSLDEFPISGAVVPDHPEFPEHWHRFVEIAIVVGGTGVHILNDQELPIAAGHVFVLPPGFKHAYHNPVGLSLINICYDPERLGFDGSALDDLHGYHALFHVEPRLRSSGNLEHVLRLEPKDLCRIEALALRIVDESRKRPKGFRLMALARLFQLITELSRLYDRPLTAPSALAHRLAGVIKYLESHIQEEIDFDEVSEKFHLSKRSFYRLLTSVTGQSPLAYLRTCRLKEAARLLQETDRPVTEIAYDVGFRDSSHFSRRFHEMFGQTPSDFRNQKL
jgi:AraC family L-rhamnose operon transcriptional activator RhaR/AraC family L-rhamnose operon regulatory protein RhaS